MLSSVLSITRKYRSLFLLLGAVLLLSACSMNTEPIQSDTPGLFNHFIIYPFSFLITFFADLFQGSYGISIIIMTVLLRLVLMPLMMKQYKGQLTTKHKMAQMKPDLDGLKEKYKGKTTPEDRTTMQQEMLALYKQHQFNPITSIGCLPMLIQLPLLLGFYYAIVRTPEIAQHTFLWFSLGESDMILPFIAGVIYFVQMRVSQSTLDEAQRKQMQIVSLIIPIMMLIFSLNVAAALPLYWSIGGIYLLIQTLFFRWYYREQDTEQKKALASVSS
ncbi:membrane protein insertase YidC [Paenalkalicoccus suaedae]|uniref:membrane protein insertase YidC n=1 Tax=Paenalkalicoccus suaedae TaxID=2592382 RepID=UPI00201BB355|nr:membrane protein insertase YidC [Paenalkalicoccus suaedae]